MQNKNKIVLFGPYPPPYGGVAIYVSALLRLFKEKGYEVELKPYKNQDKSIDKSVQPNFKSIYKNFSKLDRNSICLDSCSFFFEYPSSVKLIATWLLIKFTASFSWIKIFHDGTLPRRYKKFSFYQRFLFFISQLFVDEFVVVNTELEKWLKSDINIKQKITVIGSLLPLSLKSNISLPENINDIFSKYDKTLCSIGVFTEEYGFNQSAEAVEEIRNETGINIALILIDGGFSTDKDFKSKVLKNRDWIIVLNQVEHPQTTEILEKSNIFVRSVKSESYGLSKVEALLQKTSVISTTAGETRGMHLYNYGNIKELKSQIKQVLSNHNFEELEKWSLFYNKVAEDNFDKIVDVITKKGI